MNPGLGFLLAVLGGLLMGSFSLPMKKTARWAWENTWLVWAVAALIVTPWTIALITCPHLMSVFAKAGSGTLLMVFLFGVGWGLGAVTFGQSISLLGMSIAFAISIGLTLALGSLIPMALKPSVFTTASGAIVTAGIGLMIVGVVISAVAGSRKEAQIKAKAGANTTSGAAPASGASAGVFIKGLTLAVLSGIFNPMLNFALNFGGGIKKAAASAGASDGGGSDAIWALTLLGGFVSNLVYCSVLLTKNRTWPGYGKPGTLSHWFLAVIMGVSWVLSVTIYGRAVPMMGVLGGSAGWAITMGCCITASNVWGIVTGEWREGRGRPLNTMVAGLAVILLAIAVIGYGNSLAG
jgi:L-rhamnose-H+ transport protein